MLPVLLYVGTVLTTRILTRVYEFVQVADMNWIQVKTDVIDAVMLMENKHETESVLSVLGKISPKLRCKRCGKIYTANDHYYYFLDQYICPKCDFIYTGCFIKGSIDNRGECANVYL